MPVSLLLLFCCIQIIEFWDLFPKAKVCLQHQCDLLEMSPPPTKEEVAAYGRLKHFMAREGVLDRMQARCYKKDERECNVEIAHEILSPLCGFVVLNSAHNKQMARKKGICKKTSGTCAHIQLPEDKGWAGLYLGKCEYRWQVFF